MQPFPAFPSGRLSFRPAAILRRSSSSPGSCRAFPRRLLRHTRGCPRRRRASITSLAFIGVTFAAALMAIPRSPQPFVFATCSSSTHSLAQAAIFDTWGAASPQRSAAGLALQQGPFHADGSRKTWELLQTGAINAGLMQYDAFTDLCGTGAIPCGIVAALHQEVILTFVRHDLGSGTLKDIAARFLASKRHGPFTVSCISPEGSQACENLKMVLRHHGFTDWRIVCAGYSEAKKLLLKGSVHAAFFVGSPLHPLIQSLGTSRWARAVGICSPEGLIEKNPALAPHTVDVGTFGAAQVQSITTLATPCVLVASHHASPASVRHMLDWLLAHRHTLSQRQPFLAITSPEPAWEHHAHPGVRPGASWLSTFTEQRIITILSITTAIISLFAAWISLKKEHAAT